MPEGHTHNYLFPDGSLVEDTVLEKFTGFEANDRLRVLCANVDMLANNMEEISVGLISHVKIQM